MDDPDSVEEASKFSILLRISVIEIEDSSKRFLCRRVEENCKYRILAEVLVAGELRYRCVTRVR